MNNTTTCLISSTTSPSNKTSPTPYVTSRQFKIAELVILSTMWLASLFGNLLVIWVVVGRKKLRTTSNLLIVNLAVCDMVCASTAIPFTLIVYNIITYPHYPYGPLGCKTIWPLSTYCNNGSVFTLVAIAIERYVNTSLKHRLTFTKKRVGYVIAAVHVLAFSAVVPYVLHLRYIVVGGVAHCYEAWDREWAEFYTIALVLIQYAMPLLIMFTLYSLAWRAVYKRNREAIKMSEDYENKMQWRASLYARASLAVTTLAPLLMKTDAIESRSNAEAKTCLLQPGYLANPQVIKRTETEPVKRASSIKAKDQKRFMKSGYKSEAGFIRHRQSVLTLKMFTLVVVVFAVFALPMQIAWILGHVVSSLTFQIFVILTYVNPVVNCWIYGRYNKGIRHAYKHVLRLPFGSTAGRKNSSMMESVTTTTTATMMARTTTTTTTSFYDPRGESMHVRRQEAFEQMFQAHMEESSNFLHLYRTGVGERTQEESE